MQEYKNYEYTNSLKKCLDLADVILYCCDNIENIKKNIKYLKGRNNLFYVNFGEASSEAFTYLNAKKVSISASTKKPNVITMQQALDKEQTEWKFYINPTDFTATAHKNCLCAFQRRPVRNMNYVVALKTLPWQKNIRKP